MLWLPLLILFLHPHWMTYEATFVFALPTSCSRCADTPPRSFPHAVVEIFFFTPLLKIPSTCDHSINCSGISVPNLRASSTLTESIDGRNPSKADLIAHHLNYVTNSASPPLVIGSRGSKLAVCQAKAVKERLEGVLKQYDCSQEVLIKIIQTTGDVRVDTPLWKIGGKGLFSKELEEALLNEEIDMCAHSSKDVPTWLREDTTLACYLPREVANDVFISDKYKHYREMPPGAVVGTSSLRRKSQLLLLNPWIKIVPLRGNVDTRLMKVKKGDVDATMLALSGLKRLSLEAYATQIFTMHEMLPAAGQGAIVVQCREKAHRLTALLRSMSCKDTECAVSCERSFLEVLNGTCKTPIAGHAFVKDNKLFFSGLVASPDGTEVFRIENEGLLPDSRAIGMDAGMKLKVKAGEAFMKRITEHS